MSEEIYDLVVVGGGPAGMSAAINACARNKKVAIFESGQLVEKIDLAPHVGNYLGFSDVTGSELADKFIAHIEDEDIPVINEKVVKAFPMGDKIMLTTNNENYETKKMILAIGVSQKAKLEGEAEYIGNGVSYCATCDGKLYQDQDVIVISESAHHEEEANFLAGICDNVYYLAKYDEIDHLDNRIKVIEGEVEKIKGADKVNKIKLNRGEYEVEAVFILRDSVPPSEIVPGLELDGRHIKIDCNFETSADGIYAAGDCAGEPWQIGKAVGEGQVAALNAIKELDK
ncbi:MAG: NAD(P)/FAD-dependent oxidoreductase [Bacillota bacterium]